jgi:hypothetical protein
MKPNETPDIKIDQYAGPCVEILVDTSEADCDKAIMLGSPIADIIAGLAITRLSSDIIHKKIWAGVVGTRTDGSKSLVGTETFESWAGAPLERLKERATELSKFDPAKFIQSRPILSVSCRWFLKGLLDTNLNDSFLSVWLSTLALYSSWCESQKESYSKWCQSHSDRRDTERNRIRYYIQTRLNLTGDDERIFYEALSDSYDLRNKLLHEGKIEIIKNLDFERLAKATGSMLWVELDFPVGGSPAVLLRR